jgi:hypothetical protein
VVTREDLSPGYQATQAVHAAVQYAVEHHIPTRRWNRGGHLVVLAAPDEWELKILAEDLFTYYRITCEWFEEPDIDDELTAIAFMTDKKIAEVSRLPLALATPTDPRFLREREIRDSLRKEVS